MLSAYPATATAAIMIFALSACGPQLSRDEQFVLGQWQINTRNGAVWRYRFYRDHTLTVALPRDDTVDANERYAAFRVVDRGTWHIEGNDVVYTLRAQGELPERTTRFPLEELRQARPFPDRDAPQWERM